MSTLSELLKEVLSLSDPSNKKNKKKESKKKDKKTSSLLSKIKGEDEEVQIVEVEKEVIPVVLPISSQKTTKLLVFVDSLLPATNTITMQSNDFYDVISELWHYLSRELQASHRSTKTNHKMKLTEASSPTTAISPALAHKLRCMNLIDTLIHKYTSFRDIVQTNMSLISKSAGLMKNQNLSNEILAKGDYVDYVLERIALWDMLYGDEVEGFRMMKRYLVEVVKVKVPNLMAKARQHEKDQELQRNMTKNLLLYQGEQILKSGVLRDLKVEVEQEVHSIEEFFNILFPTFDTLLEHADLTSKMNETISIKDQTEKGIEEDIDWNKIEWVSAGQEDAEQEDEDEDHEEEYTYPLALPQQIEFELKTSMQDIISDENKDIIESIRNLATHLINHSVPKLKSWKDIFTKVVVQYEEMIADSDVSNQPKKRSRGESSSSSAMPSSEHHQQQLETALHQANQALLIVEVLLEKIKAIITGKCKQLFAS